METENKYLTAKRWFDRLTEKEQNEVVDAYPSERVCHFSMGRWDLRYWEILEMYNLYAIQPLPATPKAEQPYSEHIGLNELNDLGLIKSAAERSGEAGKKIKLKTIEVFCENYSQIIISDSVANAIKYFEDIHPLENVIIAKDTAFNDKIVFEFLDDDYAAQTERVDEPQSNDNSEVLGKAIRIVRTHFDAIDFHKPIDVELAYQKTIRDITKLQYEK